MLTYTALLSYMKNRLICRLCHNDTLQSLMGLEYGSLQKCGECGFSEVTETPNDETIKQIYSQKDYFCHNKYEDLSTQNKEHERRLRIVSQFVQDPRANILEVGCAAGDFIKYVDGKYVMWGIDVSEAVIEEARARVPQAKERFQTGFVENQTYAECFFDAMVMWDVIEHLRDPFAVLTQLHYHLKRGGYFILSTPNIASLTARVLGKFWPLMTPPEHLSFFTQKSFRLFFEKKLNCRMIQWESKGKWANVGFLLHKIKAVLPHLIPNGLIKLFELKYTKRWALYVPTGDIQYVVVQKL